MKGTKRASKKRKPAGRRSSTLRSNSAKRKAVAKLYKSSTRADLLRMLIDPEETSVDRILELTRLRRAELVAEVEGCRARAVARSREKCPKGCAPGSPDCDLTHWITTVTPYPTPFTLSATKLRANQTMLDWTKDELHPPPPPTRDEAIERMAELWRGLYRQFPVPEHQIGWWWRKPLAWFYRLKQRWTWRHFDR